MAKTYLTSVEVEVEARNRVRAAIESLSARDREVLVLKEFEGLRYREIAELVGIPIGTVMSRLYEARKRLAAALERVAVERKIDIGEWLLTRLTKAGESPQSWWAVGRIGARVPFHGSAHNVVPPATAAAWLERLLHVDWKKHDSAAFAAVLLARVSGDRERDLDAAVRQRVIERLSARKAPESWLQMVSEVVELSEADERRVFGESLPAGLKLIH